MFAPSAFATTISTVPSWDGTLALAPFGYPDTATYGQVITGTGESLQSFTFEMNLSSGTVFKGGVSAWAGDHATTPLWVGADRTTSGSGGFEAVTFAPGNVVLQTGQQYVIFATTLASTGTGTGTWGLVPTDVYAGGNTVWQNGGAGNGLNTLTGLWDGSVPSFDLAFTIVLGTNAVWVAPPPTGAYCAVAGNTWQDGSPIAPGTFLYLLYGQPDTDPHYKGAGYALFVEGKGLTCDPAPPGYVQDGYAGDAQHVASGIYPHYVPGG